MLPNLFKEFIELLEKHGVKFLIVGGSDKNKSATKRGKDRVDLEELRQRKVNHQRQGAVTHAPVTCAPELA